MQPLRNLGDYIRDQRKVSEVSLRQLAAAAGVSNPYLSQIERGLRKPSADILQQLAKGLRVSAEALYVQAGILDERVGGDEVPAAIHADSGLSDRQKQVLLEIYDSFCQENSAAAAAPVAPRVPAEAPDPAPVPAEAPPPPVGSTMPMSTATSMPMSTPTPVPTPPAKKAAKKAAKAPAKAAKAAKATKTARAPRATSPLVGTEPMLPADSTLATDAPSPPD